VRLLGLIIARTLTSRATPCATLDLLHHVLILTMTCSIRSVTMEKLVPFQLCVKISTQSTTGGMPPPVPPPSGYAPEHLTLRNSYNYAKLTLLQGRSQHRAFRARTLPPQSRFLSKKTPNLGKIYKLWNVGGIFDKYAKGD